MRAVQSSVSVGWRGSSWSADQATILSSIYSAGLVHPRAAHRHGRTPAVALAQPAEHWIVAPEVTGSSPVGHPNSLATTVGADPILVPSTSIWRRRRRGRLPCEVRRPICPWFIQSGSGGGGGGG